MLNNRFLALMVLVQHLSFNSYAEEAFGKPGMTPHWSSAKKVQAITFYEPYGKSLSPLWFTLAHGVLTEVFFPTVDTAQIKDSQILMVGPSGEFYEERVHLQHHVNKTSSALLELVNYLPENKGEIRHRFFSLGDMPILIDHVTINIKEDGWKFYQIINPHLNNTGYHDTANLTKLGFAVQDGKTFMEVDSTCGFEKRSVGFVGQSDGYQDLVKDKKMDYTFDQATNGNIALTGKLALPEKAGSYQCYIIYAFQSGSFNQQKNLATFKRDLLNGEKQFDESWDRYLSTLKYPSFQHSGEKYLYERSLVVLKSHEDKLNPGAMVASLSVPWGEKQSETQDGGNIGGYHLIWPRDLFHVSLAMLLSGDIQAPVQALGYLSKIQYGENSGKWDYGPRQIEKKGAWPQNTWVSGKEYWGGLQLDQVGYPVQLFYHVYQSTPMKERQKLVQDFSPMVNKAIDFIMRFGPWTGQERWEENFGISPSSFSAATAALLMNAKFSAPNPRSNQAKRIARQWLDTPGDNIDSWTFTTKGYHGDGQYYLRVAGCSSFEAMWNPNDGSSCHVANSNNRVMPSQLVDQGFLQLSLLGLRPANDDKILKSLNIVNSTIRVHTPKGTGWYRYSHDAYGEDQKGRLWPLLSGEHGRFALERLRVGNLTLNEAMAEVQSVLDGMNKMANAGGMIPEQVFEESGEGTGGATPLAWSHAEYIKLLWSRHHMRNVENILE